ncbi:MAG: NUDIX domain-containing protein [Candidatus Woesearchaeota archaeon]
MEQPLLVTVAMIVEKNKILLVKRSRTPFKGYWSLIGGCGAFEKYSDPLDAVKLEVKADLNCSFAPEFLTYSYHEFRVPTVSLFFYGKIIGKPSVNKEFASEYNWFPLKEAAKMELAFAHGTIVSQLISRLKEN